MSNDELLIKLHDLKKILNKSALSRQDIRKAGLEYQVRKNFGTIRKALKTLSLKFKNSSQSTQNNLNMDKQKAQIFNKSSDFGNLVDFSLIQSHVIKLSQELGQKPEYSFIYLVLMLYLNLDQTEAEDAIIDGPNDCGIDAIYFDKTDSESPIVYIFQSKYYLNPDKYSRSFEGEAVEKIMANISSLFLKPNRNRIYTNPKLKQKIDEYFALVETGVPSFKIVFCSNSYPIQSASQAKFNDWLNDQNVITNSFKHESLYLRRISSLLAPKQRKVLNGALRLSGRVFEWSAGNAKTIMGKVSVTELANLCKEHGEYLFDQNIRIYLTESNIINKKIQKTLESKDSYNFFYLNNGITIVCNRVKYNPMESPIIEMQGFQIINGSQTTHTILNVFEKNKIHNTEDVFVLVKVIETDDEKLLSQITEATNSQTAVTARDLLSNDPIQKIIEESLKLKGYYYEARKNKFLSDRDIKPQYRVDAATAAQAWFAYKFQKPHFAEIQKKKMFTDYYSSIFSNDMDIDKFLNVFLLFKHIYRLCQNERKRYPFANYAKFHILALMRDLNISDVSDLERQPNIFNSIMIRIDKLLSKDKLRANYTGYTAYFHNPQTLTSIKKELSQ